MVVCACGMITTCCCCCVDGDIGGRAVISVGAGIVSAEMMMMMLGGWLVDGECCRGIGNVIQDIGCNGVGLSKLAL